MTETDWAARIKDGQARVLRLRERLDAGEDEASAMAAEGFSGHKGVEARVEAVRAAYFADKG